MYIYLYTSPHLNVKIPKGRDFVYLQYLESLFYVVGTQFLLT